MAQSSYEAIDPIQHQILKQRFGELLNWRTPEITRTIGPYDPSVFHAFDERRRQIIDDCVRKLGEFTEEQLEFLTRRGIQEGAARETQREWEKLHSAEVSFMKDKQPPWYAGGFGHPEHVADFDYWSRMPRFTVEETTCLSIGIEPEAFPAHKLIDLQNSPSQKPWPQVQFLARRYEQLRRQFQLQALVSDVRPKAFLEWVERVEFELHPEFQRLLKARHLNNASTTVSVSVADERKPDRREIDKIAQLFTAMAIDSLGYVPGDTRSPIPKQIADIAAGMGMSVSDDTVRKYLRTGATFLPSGWKPGK